ncbi:hypothetical protein [Caenispirillum bisanense]|uniref:PDC sensor domain-containing protein n=1 Tax=Caenispirillum bisanense TaxID=414052 RepID=UPI0031D2F481
MLRFRKAAGDTARERNVYAFDMPDEEPRFAVKRWLAIFAVAVVILGVVGHVTYVRDNTFAAARSQGLIAANLLAQNSARLFDLAEYLAIDTVGRVSGRSLEDISADRALWQTLSATVSRFPYVSAVTLVDTEGNVRLTTLDFPPPPLNVLDRDYVTGHLNRPAGAREESLVSRPIFGPLAKRPVFFVSRPWHGPDGTLLGVVAVSLRSDYFQSFLETFRLPYNPTLQLVRQRDGAVIVREPGGEVVDIQHVPEPILTTVTSGRLTQPLETAEALITVQRLPQWPVHAVVSFDREMVEQAWKSAAVDFVVIGAVAIAALIALAALVPGRRPFR